MKDLKLNCTNCVFCKTINRSNPIKGPSYTDFECGLLPAEKWIDWVEPEEYWCGQGLWVISIIYGDLVPMLGGSGTEKLVFESKTLKELINYGAELKEGIWTLKIPEASDLKND